MPRVRQSEAETLVERLRRRVMNELIIDGQPVTASFGLTEYRSNDDQASLLARADQALYAAKTAGRNRVSVMA